MFLFVQFLFVRWVLGGAGLRGLYEKVEDTGKKKEE
jgi:hypothetical protein